MLKNEAIRSYTAYRPRYNSTCRHGLRIPNTMAIPLFPTVFKLSTQYIEILSFLHNSTATHTICVASSLPFRQSLTFYTNALIVKIRLYNKAWLLSYQVAIYCLNYGVLRWPARLQVMLTS